MTTRYELNAPYRMWETWAWVNAFYAFDFGDPQPLSELIQTEYIPQEFRTAVADVITGKRKPNKRAASKLKIPPAQIMLLARDVDLVLGALDVYRHGEFLEVIADSRKQEVSEFVSHVQKFGRSYLEKVAKKFKVSTETIENITREMRKRIDRWPIV